MIKAGFKVFVACVAGLGSALAYADLYGADAAYQAKDFPKAFELYRELAELGHAESQETLAIMYVQGEGVKRDNMLGYAWASLVLEQHPSEASQSIADQLKPHLSEAGRKTADDVRAKFGQAALKRTVLHLDKVAIALSRSICKMKAPVNPNDFFPPEAAQKGISGFAIIDARVFSDGRDHDPRANRLIPAQPFDGPAMLVSMNNLYSPQTDNGVPGPCAIRFKVKFNVTPHPPEKPNTEDLAVGSKRPEARFYLAALLATNPDAQVRDPKRALEIFGGDQGIYDQNPIAFEIRAAARAQTGDFFAAVDLQKKAIRMARVFHWNNAPLDVRLVAYQAKQTWTGDLLAFY